MPDITMCMNESCPRHESCYRFTADPSPWRQSYAGFAPDDSGNCKYFTDNGRTTDSEGE